jgi:tRNA U38,U39,U40 pseudouridine synthase TruA
MVNENFNDKEAVLKAFPTEQACILHLEKLRWGIRVVSPFDSFSKVYLCKGDKYRCRNTGKYFNVRTDTIFSNSRIPLQIWFLGIWLVTTQSGITSIQLSKELNITQKTAWYMLKRIKAYLGNEDQKVFRKASSAKTKNTQKIEAIEVTAEKDKLQMLEWLKLLKK